MARLLIDLSAWARSGHGRVRGRWAELVGGDCLLCHPVFAVELLHSATSPGDYRRLRADIGRGFDWLWPDQRTAETAMELQQRMATSAPTGQRVKTADLLIAALAVQHGLGVVHYDSDYDLILEHGGERFTSEWLAPRGSLETGEERGTSARKAYRQAFGKRMVQFRDDTDLDVWPNLMDWLDDQLRDRGLDIPAPPELP